MFPSSSSEVHTYINSPLLQSPCVLHTPLYTSAFVWKYISMNTEYCRRYVYVLKIKESLTPGVTTYGSPHCSTSYLFVCSNRFLL